ncbi:MAG: exo-alpha-sialidase, partial [Gammaproteobacteria bacterium]
QKRGEDSYAYEVRIAQSLDGGATWSGSHVLHDDSVAAEHGFVSLWETPQGEVQAAWLDGRGTGAHATHGEMQLGFSPLSPEGVPGPTELIDTRTCDCCQTDAAWSTDGPVLAYRDRSVEEVRDISVLRRVQGAWQEPVRVHADGWQIDGCPVNGPAIAAQDRRVAVAWFTAAQDRARVSVAFSEDGAAHFGPAFALDEGAPLGRVDLVLDGEGSALVSWMERSEGDAARVMLRRVHPDGTRSAPVEIARSSASRASGFPRMVAANDAVILAWTEAGTPSRVRLARLSLEP